MLNNPDWGKQGETLEALIEWLETKPPEKVYVYGDVFHCLAAQYLNSIGKPYHCIHPLNSLEPKFNKEWPFEKQVEWLGYRTERTPTEAYPTGRTFGDALKLAKEVAA